LTNVYPQTQPVIIQVPSATPVPVNVTTITAGSVNAPSVAYHHVQGVVASSWTIVHNLGFYPNVTVQDSTGTIVEGEITYTNPKQLTVSFQSAFSGNAYLS
jgi:hypothetical protein